MTIEQCRAVLAFARPRQRPPQAAGRLRIAQFVTSLNSGGAERQGCYAALLQKRLPPGLTLDPNTGLISGTIVAGASLQGPFTVTISAADALSYTQQTFVWNVNVPVSLASPGDQNNNVPTDSVPGRGWISSEFMDRIHMRGTPSAPTAANANWRPSGESLNSPVGRNAGFADRGI